MGILDEVVQFMLYISVLFPTLRCEWESEQHADGSSWRCDCNMCGCSKGQIITLTFRMCYPDDLIDPGFSKYEDLGWGSAV